MKDKCRKLFAEKAAKYQIICFLVTFILFFICNLLWSRKTVYYDSRSYWYLADEILEGGFLAYPESFRGYFFPYIMTLLKNWGMEIFHSEWIFFMLFSSFTAAAAIVYVIPNLLNIDNVSGKRFAIGSLFFVLLVMFFWKDVIFYPLTDLFAMTFFGIALFILKNSHKNGNKWKIGGGR